MVAQNGHSADYKWMTEYLSLRRASTLQSGLQCTGEVGLAHVMFKAAGDSDYTGHKVWDSKTVSTSDPKLGLSCANTHDEAEQVIPLILE